MGTQPGNGAEDGSGKEQIKGESSEQGGSPIFEFPTMTAAGWSTFEFSQSAKGEAADVVVAQRSASPLNVRGPYPHPPFFY